MHTRCSSQNRLNLFRVDGWTVKRRLAIRQLPAVTAGRVRPVASGARVPGNGVASSGPAIEELAALGIDGVEAFYVTHTAEQTRLVAGQDERGRVHLGDHGRVELRRGLGDARRCEGQRDAQEGLVRRVLAPAEFGAWLSRLKYSSMTTRIRMTNR